MNRKLCLAFVIFSLFFPIFAESSLTPLTTWDFYWGKFIHSNTDEVPDLQVEIPSNWKNPSKIITGEKQKYGFSSYRKIITGLDPELDYAVILPQSPESACKLFVNGQEIFSVGSVSSSKENHKSSTSPIFVSFKSDNSGTAEIIFHISNFEKNGGGLTNNVFLGLKQDVFKYFISQNGTTWLVIGTLIILSCLNILLYFLSSRKKENLFFSFLTFILAARLGVSRFPVFAITFPILPHELLLRIDYFTIWSSPLLLCFIALIRSVKRARQHIVTKLFIGVAIGIGLITTLAPISIATILLPIVEGLSFSIITLSFISLLCQLRNKNIHTVLNLISFTILAVALYSDIFHITNKTSPFSFFPLLFFTFSLFQFLSLAAQQRILHSTQKKLVVNLKQLNDMCLKFVPKEFLTQIDKNSINKVSLGDYTEKNMTISYTNLEFSSIWENEISAEQEYTLFSNCVSLIYPIIKKHNGYIAKIISQNIICLFSKHPSDAINCTMEITTELEKYMNQLNNESLVLKKSTGIHYGKMVLGTIGEEGRLDDTVISESVSLVARLSAVARNMGINFLFSDTFYNLISENNYDFAQLGQTVIKGKSQPITIYTCSKKKEKNK